MVPWFLAGATSSVGMAIYLGIKKRRHDGMVQGGSSAVRIRKHLAKILRDTAFISAVLFTIALLWPVPYLFESALAGYDRVGLQRLEGGWLLYARAWGDLAIASLGVILIGLIVLWTGYIKKVRWTWFVMFVIVWGWAFPTFAFRDFVYPLYNGALKIESLSGFFLVAFGEPGGIRSIVHEMITFALMVIALVLPVKAFFWRPRARDEMK